MLLDIIHFKDKYNLDIRGVVHVGGHFGEEDSVYQRMNILNKIYLEPCKENFKVMQERIKDSILINKAAGDENTTLDMFVETVNEGQSNSLLEPDVHLNQYPHIQFPQRETVEVIKLDDLDVFDDKYNFINMDVQGYELKVLQGAKEKLNHIDCIISEINRGELYKGCAKVWELEEFLKPYGFEMVESHWFQDGLWGDGFFVKK